MCKELHLFHLTLPAYSLAILCGVFAANLLAWRAVKKRGLDFMDVILLEAIVLPAGFIGAKLLYLFVSRHDIDWSRLGDMAYLSLLLTGGLVFYGGLILGTAVYPLAARLFHIDGRAFLPIIISVVPAAHGFGRIGCFMAGCCYGMRYDGPLAVYFPEGSFAPAGVGLFPVQLLEALLLFGLSALLLWYEPKHSPWKTVGLYMGSYGVIRFALEFLRGDRARGFFLALSTSQWISLGMAAAAVLIFALDRKLSRPKARP